jgi:TfoX/Sxy family transcriptional regulator of competence genes
MAYDVELAQRIRDLASGTPGLTEKPMFGGLAFLVGGNMAIAASGEGGVLVRVDPSDSDGLVSDTPAEPAVMRGRAMSGWLRVADEHLDDAELERWVGIGTSYASTLPPK